MLRVVHEFHLPSPHGRRGEFEEVVGFEVEFGLSAKDVFRFGGEPAVVEVEQVEAGGGVEQREHFAGHGGEKAVDGLCLGTRGEQEQEGEKEFAEHGIYVCGYGGRKVIYITEKITDFSDYSD